MSEKRLSVKLTLNDKQFQNGLRKTTTSLKKLGKNLQNTGREMSTNFTLPILAAGGAAVKMAADYEESLNKTRVAFGESSASVEAFAKTTLNSFGIAESSALQMASLFGDMATGMGVSENAAAGMSQQLVGLAGDLASFKNIGIEQAETALAGIFTGETESLKKLGIVITEANLKQFGYNKTMTQTEKIAIRYKAVMAMTAKAQGDFSRTSGSLTNQTRGLGETMKELSVELGTILIPIALKLVTHLKSLAERFRGLDEGTKRTIVEIAGFIAIIGPLQMGIGKLISVLGMATKSIRFLGAVIASNPLGLIITGVALAVSAIVFFATSSSNVAKKVREFFRTMVNGVILSINKLIKAANMIPGIDIPFINFIEKEKPADEINETADAVQNLSDATFDLSKNVGKVDKIKAPAFSGKVAAKKVGPLATAGVPSSKDLRRQAAQGEGPLAKVEMPDFGDESARGAFGFSAQFFDDMTASVENFGAVAGNVFQGLGDVMNTMFENQLAKIEEVKMADLEQLDRDHAYTAFLAEQEKLRVANMSVAERKEFLMKQDFEKKKQAIEEKAANESAKIRRKQAKLNKAASIFNATINTAQGVTAALANANIPLSVAIGIAGAAQVAAITASPLPALAEGGIAFGDSLVRVGEYSGANVNPEVIAPLNKLEKMMGGSRVEVFGSISGQDIVLSSERFGHSQNRSF